MRIYLDNCCYNRPFDDRTNVKNYLEREAVLLVMQRAFDGEYEIYGSDVLVKEMKEIANAEKKKCVEGLYYAIIKENIALNGAIVVRAEEIMQQANIRAFDSLHLASAESGADVFLTTDIKLLKSCRKLNLEIKVKNPIEFVMAGEENERDD